MAALAEQMSNECAQREGEVRRRHEAAMAKLALNREQQVCHFTPSSFHEFGHSCTHIITPSLLCRPTCPFQHLLIQSYMCSVMPPPMNSATYLITTSLPSL